MTHRVVAIVGMPGAGKSELASFLRLEGFVLVHFGDATADELARRGLRVSEANERVVREELRALHGMAAYAILNLPRIEAALASSHVVVDGLYSWEEYLVLKEKYGDRLVTVAVTASPATRQKRLASRPVRPLSAGEVASRDRAEIEKINKGGPIAMADITLVNEGTLPELLERAGSVLEAVR
jgi:dephospho-CoA kinase